MGRGRERAGSAGTRAGSGGLVIGGGGSGGLVIGGGGSGGLVIGGGVEVEGHEILIVGDRSITSTSGSTSTSRSTTMVTRTITNGDTVINGNRLGGLHGVHDRREALDNELDQSKVQQQGQSAFNIRKLAVLELLNYLAARGKSAVGHFVLLRHQDDEVGNDALLVLDLVDVECLAVHIHHEVNLESQTQAGSGHLLPVSHGVPDVGVDVTAEKGLNGDGRCGFVQRRHLVLRNHMSQQVQHEVTALVEAECQGTAGGLECQGTTDVLENVLQRAPSIRSGLRHGVGTLLQVHQDLGIKLLLAHLKEGKNERQKLGDVAVAVGLGDGGASLKDSDVSHGDGGASLEDGGVSHGDGGDGGHCRSGGKLGVI